MLITLPWVFTTWFLTSFLWSTNRLENWKLAVDNQRGMVLSLNLVIWCCLCLCDRRRRHMARYKSSIAANITLPFRTFIMFFSVSIEKLSKRLLIWKPFFFLYNSGTSCRPNVRQRLFNLLLNFLLKVLVHGRFYEQEYSIGQFADHIGRMLVLSVKLSAKEVSNSLCYIRLILFKTACPFRSHRHKFI